MIHITRRKNISSPPLRLPHTYMYTHHILYIFYLKPLTLRVYHCFSLEFHFRNANVLGSDSPWFISLFIFAHICLCPCVCLLLIPPFFQPACLLWDRGLPHMPPSGPHTCLCTCVRAHMHTESGTNQLGSLLRCFIQPSPCYCKLLGPSNPVCSRPCTRVSALRALIICMSSLLVSEHCGGAILEAIERDLISTLAFCQQGLHSDEHDGSSGQTNLLLYVSCRQIEFVQGRLELCFSCQKKVWKTAGPATTPPSEASYLLSTAIK